MERPVAEASGRSETGRIADRSQISQIDVDPNWTLGPINDCG
jgi:hypothetical protein